MSAAVPRSLNLVGGTWYGDDTDDWLEVTNPADAREVLGVVPRMGRSAIDAVYDAARRGADTSRELGAIERGRILLRAAALLRERRGEIARVLTLEMGKTLREATAEVDKSADFFEYYGGLARAPAGELLAHERGDVTAWTVHEPVGIVLAITPWNDPLLTPARKLAPALLAGNAVILKPASYTPLVALELARVLNDAALPAGILNTVTGSGAEIGDALTAHPDLAAVSFTGSNEVGAELRRVLADREVRLLAELGGKNAAVVLADADLALSAATIAAAAFAQAGQRCTATSRVIVQRAVAGELVERLVAAARRQVVGPGIRDDTTMGPLVATAQRDSVRGFVERASRSGCRLLTGGTAPDDEPRRHGSFLDPAVVVDVEPDMELWTDEIFGPVLGLVTVESEHEAIEVLNASAYGLAASVFTRDLRAAHEFAAAADVGQVAVNLPTSGWDVHLPFGGFKASGSGHKEQGLEGLDFYRRTKTVAVAA
jgi:acyl-CoA reductase-like NAD-dependent aldehyde dehydrogenase